ncbi:MAG: hypothetical protein NZM42_05990 [Gemmatales bacterium]|nr:hypothetical protein [Gemmatales bacterium]
MSRCYWNTRKLQLGIGGKLVCLLLIVCLHGCQQMQGSRFPTKSGRNPSDPFLSSPTSRIPPTPMPALALDGPGARIPAPRDRVDQGSRWVVPGKVGTSDERTGVGVEPASWNSTRGKIDSWEEAFRRLRARGVHWQKLEMQGTQWRFECSAPDPYQAGQIREYYAVAPDPLQAVSAVLEKIENAPR